MINTGIAWGSIISSPIMRVWSPSRVRRRTAVIAIGGPGEDGLLVDSSPGIRNF
jgi:hypothetical protein